MIPCEFPDDLYLSETRMIVLRDGENRMIVASFMIYLGKTPECDGRTDIRRDGGQGRNYYSGSSIASNADPLQKRNGNCHILQHTS